VTIERALVHPRLEGIEAYVPAPGEFAIRLDANESAWSLEGRARELVQETLAAIDWRRYPDARATELRERLAARLGCRFDETVVGAGSDEVIALLLHALGRPRTDRSRIAVPVPTFVMYGMNALAQGFDVVEIPLGPSFELDAGAMCAAIERHRPNLVFLASPNNPTGNRFDTAAIELVLECDRETLVVIDEAYVAFAGPSLVRLCDAHPNAALLGTFSKVGLAAARVGYARLPAALSSAVHKVRQPFNLGTASQAIATLALGELAPHLDELARRVVAERARLVEKLGALAPRIAPYASEANFVLCRCDRDPTPMVKALAERGIAIRNFHKFGGALANHVRISVGKPADTDALVTAMAEALASSAVG
jgi:histidinol-phosphate aminotransferase